MSVEGLFHDAHEVNVTRDGTTVWVATFSTKARAEQYAQALTPPEGAVVEVVPV